jgi:TonB family protein
MMPAGPEVPVPAFDLRPTPLSPADFAAASLQARTTSGRSIEPVIGGENVYSAEEVDQVPELSAGMRPEYPEDLQRAGIGGAVLVEYVVLPNGRVDSASIRVISSTDTRFTMSVIECLLAASFKPARRRGLAVPALVQQTIRFENR